MSDKVNILKLSLHGQVIAYLVGFQHGRSTLSFTEEFKTNPYRPTLSLITHPSFPHVNKDFRIEW